MPKHERDRVVKEQREYLLPSVGAPGSSSDDTISKLSNKRKRSDEKQDISALANGLKKAARLTKKRKAPPPENASNPTSNATAEQCKKKICRSAPANRVKTSPSLDISPPLLAKIARIKTSLASIKTSKSYFRRSTGTLTLLLVPERTLLGALTSLRVDFAMDTDASLDDARPCIDHHFVAAVQQTADQGWVALAVSPGVYCDLEVALKAKVQGHGLKEVNLLETELEMLAQEAEERTPSEDGSVSTVTGGVVSDQTTLQAFWDEKMEAFLKANDEAKAAEKADDASAEKRALWEWVGKGVCPAPMVAVV
ncbi:hypothetical protein BAUCODRAFT_519408 [Baudoinia panamericana UAMH 10762]|uniref:Uncharacterized protein n=1 Tax=Baudoinia panamericana (strain UAMH 10762) TaxID=717646 RepID=M2N779_BAUPA|nr:uncharacterized protein BAUCODRAFT_519408 [Baudoinia panamericana UAMH 10762]EMC94929.1 hypothetical protein BAUCODRAFT_519408 [Baudoinia panamericana UAMH 10762]